MTRVVPIRKPPDEKIVQHHTKMETLLLSPEIMEQWKLPPFQRPLKENDKVREIAEQLQDNGGIIPGIITLGTVPGDSTIYICDGQHRRLSAVLSGLKEFIGDVRTIQFDSMEEMAAEYVRLNDFIVKMQPDDKLRAMECATGSPLQIIRKRCDFVGYDNIRRSPYSPLIGMAQLLRCWRGSGHETPGVTGGTAAMAMAEELTPESAEEACKFLLVARSAWGNDPENNRLWSALNLTMCMWLWRVLVVDNERRGSKRYIALSVEQYKHCLMQVSADRDYAEWLIGRSMTETHRAPCYKRLRSAFTARLHQEGLMQFKMPRPIWAT